MHLIIPLKHFKKIYGFKSKIKYDLNWENRPYIYLALLPSHGTPPLCKYTSFISSGPKQEAEQVKLKIKHIYS